MLSVLLALASIPGFLVSLFRLGATPVVGLAAAALSILVAWVAMLLFASTERGPSSTPKETLEMIPTRIVPSTALPISTADVLGVAIREARFRHDVDIETETGATTVLRGLTKGEAAVVRDAILERCPRSDRVGA
jgi:hypothetical protein